MLYYSKNTPTLNLILSDTDGQQTRTLKETTLLRQFKKKSSQAAWKAGKEVLLDQEKSSQHKSMIAMAAKSGE